MLANTVINIMSYHQVLLGPWFSATVSHFRVTFAISQEVLSQYSALVSQSGDFEAAVAPMSQRFSVPAAGAR